MLLVSFASPYVKNQAFGGAVKMGEDSKQVQSKSLQLRFSKGILMDKETSLIQDKSTLTDLIKYQPNLFSISSGTLINDPKIVANFCSEFIDTFSKKLVELSKS